MLAGRIAFLIRERGIDPSSILAVSFTTEAARALRAQVGQQLGSAASDVSIHTLHALGRRVIDTWAARLGFDDRPAVLHHDEGRALLGATATDLGWDTATFSVAELAAAVDRCRLLADDEARCNDPAWPLAQAFEERMRRHGAIDFVAMLCLPLRLFREHPEALRTLQLGYQCVLADEAQDLDPTQWALLELLAAEHRNLVVVGDPVQTLFTWRGADVRGLLDFRQRHPTGQMVTLDHSHRATRHLVQLANALSDLLAYRSGLVTDNPAGPAARLLQADDEHAEADFVAQQIGSLVDRGLLEHPGHAAVLYRTRAQVDVLDERAPHRLAFRTPCTATPTCSGSASFATSWPTCAWHATPATGWPWHARWRRRRAVSDAWQPCLSMSPPPRWSSSRRWPTRSGLPSKPAPRALVATVYALHADVARGGSPAVLLDRALDQTGYRAWLERHPDGPARLRTVARLRAIAQRAEVGLGEWLDALAGGEDVDPVGVRPGGDAAQLHSHRQRPRMAGRLPAGTGGVGATALPGAPRARRRPGRSGTRGGTAGAVRGVHPPA